MTELERRALLGDRQAQEECTEKWIVLGCPLCNGKVKVSTAGRLFHCRSCNFTLTFPARLSPLEAISRWNTRPAPPIGRCVECGAYTQKEMASGIAVMGPQKPMTDIAIASTRKAVKKMRLGDLDALFCRLWGKADPFKEQPLVRPCTVWSDAATMAREAPTIDPETLPVVRQLREELDRAKKERDAAVKDLETAMKIDSEVDDIGLSCFLCRVCSKNDACNGPCEPKWRGPQKEE